MTRAELEAALAWADWLAMSKDPGPALAMAKVTDRLKEQYARVAGNPRGDITGGGEMSGTNPGAWPDQEPNEPQMSRYTAADLAKAREEGRREAEAKFWPIFMWLLGYTDWPERKPGEGAFYWRGKLRRDLENTITDFDALLAEGKKEGKPS